MSDFISLAFLLLAVVTFVANRRDKARKKQQEPPSRRANSAGEDGRFDRSAQRVNSVGEDGRLDREAQRVNSVGESRRRRMVEEQRAKADAFRRAHGEAAESDRPAPEQSRPARQSRPSNRPACPACGRPLKPGVKFCPGCGTATAAGAAVAVSNIPADAGIFAQGGSEAAVKSAAASASVFAQGVSEAAYSYSDGDRPPTAISPALPPLSKARPALTLPGFSGPELTRALVMAEILGPCKARQRH